MPQQSFSTPEAARILLLGPIELVAAGTPITLTGVRQRKLLAVLALNAGGVVPYEQIVEALWDVAPDSMRQQIHNAVRGLRKPLSALPGTELVTADGGYALRVPDRCIDAQDFRTAVRASELAEAEGDLARAANLAAVALSHWRGAALGDLGGRYLRALATQLDEQRLDELERLIALRLRLGTAGALIADGLRAVSENPYRESLRAAVMLALHQGGRQTEALGIYDEGRKLLAGELGLDPGPQLRDAHARVLRGEPDDSVPPPDLARSGAEEQPPRRFLPRDTSEFTGRATEIAEVLRRAQSGSGGALVISSIEGMGGVGKTALAVHLAHRVAATYPDGQYFVDLHGYSPGTEPIAPELALEILLGAAGVPIELMSGNLATRSAQWRSHLHGKRVLVLLDNVRDEAQVRALLPGTPDALVLITSRRRLTALEDNRPLLLEVMSTAEGSELFAQIAGLERISGNLAEVAAVVQLCGGLPLAIRIAAARFRDRQQWDLPALLQQLRTHDRRTRFLAVGDRSVMAVLRLSYRYLSRVHQDVFRLLSLNPAADFDAYAVAALAGISLEAAEDALDTLYECSLLIQHSAGRYEFHDLVRDCSRELRAEVDGSETERVATHRLLDYFLYIAHQCCRERVVGPFRFEPELRNMPAHVPDLSTPAGRVRVLQDTHRALLRAAWFAAENNWNSHAWQLPCAMVPFLGSMNYGAETFELFTGALAAARSIGDHQGEVASLMALAVVSRDRGDNSESQDLFRQALAVSEAYGNLAWQAQLLTDLGVSQLSDGQIGPAGESFARAYDLARETGDERLTSSSANNLGVICRERGQFDEAVEYFERGGHRGGRSTDRDRAFQLINVGLVRHLQGRHHDALGALDEALAICERTVAENRMAAVLVCQAAAHRSLGNLDRALDHGRRALRLARRFTFGEIECMALNTLGETFVSLADLATAEQVFGEAQAAAERGRHAAQAARAQEGFAHISLIRGDEETARKHWEQALRDYPADMGAADDVRWHLEALGGPSVTCLRCAQNG